MHVHTHTYTHTHTEAYKASNQYVARRQPKTALAYHTVLPFLTPSLSPMPTMHPLLYTHMHT